MDFYLLMGLENDFSFMDFYLLMGLEVRKLPVAVWIVCLQSLILMAIFSCHETDGESLSVCEYFFAKIEKLIEHCCMTSNQIDSSVVYLQYALLSYLYLCRCHSFSRRTVSENIFILRSNFLLFGRPKVVD